MKWHNTQSGLVWTHVLNFFFTISAFIHRWLIFSILISFKIYMNKINQCRFAKSIFNRSNVTVHSRYKLFNVLRAIIYVNLFYNSIFIVVSSVIAECDALMKSAPRSPIIIVAAFVFALTISGTEKRSEIKAFFAISYQKSDSI